MVFLSIAKNTIPYIECWKTYLKEIAMTDKQRKEVVLVVGGVAIGVVGGYFIGKVFGGKQAVNYVMKNIQRIGDAAKATSSEIPLIIEHIPTGTKTFCKVIPEATEAFDEMVRIF